MLTEHVAGQIAGSFPTMVDDELETIVAALCTKFPEISPTEVSSVVADAYRHLSERAALTTHLIPLTLNRSVRLLRQAQTSTRDGAVAGI